VAPDRGRDVATMRACGDYWFGDATTGPRLVLSLRDGPFELRGIERDNDRRQCRLEDALDCTIKRVSAYESLGVAAPGT
jgi:hypothetical protein